MDQLQAAFSAVDFDFKNFLLIAAILAVGSILLGAIGRFVFGKRSTLNQSVSSAIGIIFIYAATIVLYSAGARFQNFIAPLPFVSFSGTQMSVFDEPEAGIDLWSFQNLIRVFERMREKTDGSILIISHQERILNIADEIVVLADGRITKQGPKEEILPTLLGTSSAVDACSMFDKEGR